MAIYINGKLKGLYPIEANIDAIELDTEHAIDREETKYVGGDKSVPVSAYGTSALDIQSDRRADIDENLTMLNAELFQGQALSSVVEFYGAGNQSTTYGHKNYTSPWDGGWVFDAEAGVFPWSLKGKWSTAIGFQNAVSGTGSQAYGNNNIIEAYWGTAIGDHNHLFRYSSRAFGAWNILRAGENMGYGFHNCTDKWRAMAYGNYNTVSAQEGFAMGHWNKTFAPSGTAVGWGNRTAGDEYAITVGTLNQAAGDKSIAVGYHNIAGIYDDFHTTIETSMLSTTYLSAESTSGDLIPADMELYKTWLSVYPEMSADSASWGRWYLDGDPIYVPVTGATALGSHNRIYNDDGLSIGADNIVSGVGSTCIGDGNVVNVSGAVAVGSNIINDTVNSIEIGPDNVNKISIRGVGPTSGMFIFPPMPSGPPTSAELPLGQYSLWASPGGGLYFTRNIANVITSNEIGKNAVWT